MAQLRVNVPKDHEQSKTLEVCGLRWCKKDQRWEKNLPKGMNQSAWDLLDWCAENDLPAEVSENTETSGIK